MTYKSLIYLISCNSCRDERCHFLRVDKEDFNRILRDVEAKTERLKENGKDVLVLEKLSRSDGSQR